MRSICQNFQGLTVLTLTMVGQEDTQDWDKGTSLQLINTVLVPLSISTAKDRPLRTMSSP